MGADFIGHVVLCKKNYYERYQPVVDALTSNKRIVERIVRTLDDQGLLDSLLQARVDYDRVTTFEGVTNILLEGAHCFYDNHRVWDDYSLPDAPLVLRVSGGMTWGDPPYEEFGSVSVFMELSDIIGRTSDTGIVPLTAASFASALDMTLTIRRGIVRNLYTPQFVPIPVEVHDYDIYNQQEGDDIRTDESGDAYSRYEV